MDLDMVKVARFLEAAYSRYGDGVATRQQLFEVAQGVLPLGDGTARSQQTRFGHILKRIIEGSPEMAYEVAPSGKRKYRIAPKVAHLDVVPFGWINGWLIALPDQLGGRRIRHVVMA